MRSSGLWPFVVPLVAVFFAAFLFLRDWLDAGPSVVVRFPENPGLVAGLSPVRYLGVDCGVVEEIRLSKTLDAVEVTLALEAPARALARSGTLFWIVQPELTWTGVRGLDAIKSGPYLAARPGPLEKSDARTKAVFEGTLHPPPKVAAEEGASFFVYSDVGHQIRPNSPVYYRGVPVGEVARVDLESGHEVVLEVFVERRYAPLVRENSEFWALTGVKADFGLFGANIQTGTLESLFGGGVAFATPSEAGAVPKKREFRLQDEAPGGWRRWTPHIALEAR